MTSLSISPTELSAFIKKNTELLFGIAKGDKLPKNQNDVLLETISLGLVTQVNERFFLKLLNVKRTNKKKISIKGDVFALNSSKFIVVKCMEAENGHDLHEQINNYIRSYAQFYGMEKAFELVYVIDKNWNSYICEKL